MRTNFSMKYSKFQKGNNSFKNEQIKFPYNDMRIGIL